MRYIVGNHYPSNKKEMIVTKKNSAKKALLKKLVGAKVNKDGASPLKMDNGLGKTPLATKDIGSGGGSNLGTKKVF